MEEWEIIQGIAESIAKEAERYAYDDYMIELRKNGGGIEEYASRMASIWVGDPALFKGVWTVNMELPYKSPIGPSQFEYKKSRRVDYEKTESGFEITSSYGRHRKTSSTDKIIENGILSFCYEHGADKVTIIREKI